jgi:thiamine pyrophosphokinase
MAEKTWLLCAAGDWPNKAIWEPLSQSANRIVGVDGGTDIALSVGLNVNLALGDFDSIVDESVQRKELPDQNRSDLLKSLEFAASKGVSTVNVVGIEGGDVNHQLANFAALVEAPAELEVNLHLNEHVVMRCLDRLDLWLEAGANLSLFAFTSCVHVSISGVEYPLNDEALAFSTRGLHNVALGGEVKIQTDGVLVVLINQ